MIPLEPLMVPTKPPTLPAPDTAPKEPEVFTVLELINPMKPPTSTPEPNTTVLAVEPVTVELPRYPTKPPTWLPVPRTPYKPVTKLFAVELDTVDEL